MPIRQVIKTPLVSEKKSGFLSGKLIDENGAWPTGQLPTTLVVTLFHAVTLTVINSVNQLNLLNANGGTVDTSGNWTYAIAPADNPILGTDKKEGHIAFFEWTWASGAKAGDYEVLFYVVNREKVV